MKENLSCFCGRNFSIEYDEEADLDLKSELLGEICSGKFMSYTCPGCGKIHKPEKKITLVWKSKNVKYQIIPELERISFYRNSKSGFLKTKKESRDSVQTIIGFPEMADRITVLKDNLEPLIIEVLKYFLLAKAEENYPDMDINAWYCRKDASFIEFHLDGIKKDEVAVMKVPMEVYEKTFDDWKKHPKKDVYTQVFYNSYLSVQNVFKPEILI